MRAEIAKVRYLPLPRWTAAALAAVIVLTGVLLYALEPRGPENYVDTPSGIINLVTRVATLVFGVWLATLEFSSGTAQRTLTAEPSRNRVLINKLTPVLVISAIVALAAGTATIGVAELTADHAAVTIDEGDLAAALYGQVPLAVTAAAIGFGLGLISRSMAGGVALGVIFLLVLDGILALIPSFEDYTYGQLSQDLSNGLTGIGETTNGLAVAIVGLLAWCLVVVVPGWLRFLRSDLS